MFGLDVPSVLVDTFKRLYLASTCLTRLQMVASESLPPLLFHSTIFVEYWFTSSACIDTGKFLTMGWRWDGIHNVLLKLWDFMYREVNDSQIINPESQTNTKMHISLSYFRFSLGQVVYTSTFFYLSPFSLGTLSPQRVLVVTLLQATIPQL